MQLSQTGWEHVAFKNEEGGIRGREAQNEERERDGELESQNEEYSSVRKTDNKGIRWGRDRGAEIFIDRELHKTNSLPQKDIFEMLLRQFCQGWFHPGNGETDGLSLSYGLHVGG